MTSFPTDNTITLPFSVKFKDFVSFSLFFKKKKRRGWYVSFSSYRYTRSLLFYKRTIAYNPTYKLFKLKKKLLPFHYYYPLCSFYANMESIQVKAICQKFKMLLKKWTFNQWSGKMQSTAYF